MVIFCLLKTDLLTIFMITSAEFEMKPCEDIFARKSLRISTLIDIS